MEHKSDDNVNMGEETKEELEEMTKEAGQINDEAPDTILSAADMVNKLNEAEEKYQELMDKFQRSMAEFDNFRKRTAKEKTSMYNDGVVDTTEKLLPVIDNFERALLAAPDKEDSMYKGILMIYKQFEEIVHSLGVEQIDCLGQKFDPNLHYAVSHEQNSEFDENTIIEEMQKGYKFKERVLRPSMVKVAN